MAGKPGRGGQPGRSGRRPTGEAPHVTERGRIIANYYNEGHSLSECSKVFGLSKQYISAKVLKGNTRSTSEGVKLWSDTRRKGIPE